MRRLLVGRGLAPRRALAVVLLVASSSATAQPEILEFTIENQDDLDLFNAEDCVDPTQLTRRVRIQFDTTQEYFLRFVHAPAGVPNGPCPLDMLEDTLIEIETKTVDPDASSLVDEEDEITIADIMDYACDEEARIEGGAYCMQVALLASDQTALASEFIQLDFDTTIPPAITIADAVAGDGEITLTIEGIPDDGEDYDVVIEHRVCGDATAAADAGPEASICGSTEEFEEKAINANDDIVLPVENGTTVELRVFLRDDFDNDGPKTDATTVVAEATLGSLDLYNGNGGELSCAPSCGTSTESAAMGLGFLFLLSRRGRRVLHRLKRVHRLTKAGPLLIVAALFGAGSARAEFGQTTLSLSIAPYKPNIDSEVVGGEQIFPIYACFFNGANLLEVGGDVDTHLFDGFGSLQLTVGVQASQAQGKAQPLAAAGTGECETPTKTSVELTMLKLRPGITYRLDPLLDHFDVPLVPYGRVGLVGAAYAFTKQGQFEEGQVDPVGMRFGWEAAAGLSIALDFMDSIDPFVPDTTKRARANRVFNHTYLFGEAAFQSITTFDSPGLVLTPVDEFFYSRLPVVWRLGVAVELL